MVAPVGATLVIGVSITGAAWPSVTGTSVTFASGAAGSVAAFFCGSFGDAAFAASEPRRKAPIVNATIIRNPNVKRPTIVLRVRGSTAGVDSATTGGGAGCRAGTGCDCHQLQYGQTRAYASMGRPQLTQLV